MAEPSGTEQLRADLRTAWHRYVDLLAPLRPALHGFCRRLTGNLWDAEDLVQETLLRAFGQWGVSYGEVREPRAYLLRTATNVWIDLVRRREAEARVLLDGGVELVGSPSPGPETAAEVRAAGAHLVQHLSPQEAAAIVLKEAFDMSLDEIAGLLATTVGAVKAALHRARGRLGEARAAASMRRGAPSPELLDRFIALYDAKDVHGMTALLLHGASAENPGNSFHVGTATEDGCARFVRSLVHGHPEWPSQFHPQSERLARAEIEGEPVLLVLRTYPGREESLISVLRFEECQGRIARIRSYAFCPETMRAVGEMLGMPVLTGLYRAPTPEPGRAWPEPLPAAPR